MSKHNHGAALSGVKGEQRLADRLRKEGVPLLKKQGDFIKYYKQFGWTRERALQKWKEKMILACPWNDQTVYKPDGFVPYGRSGEGLTLENKYGAAHGTTEEKIFYDLEKIRAGVYPKNFAYIFEGTPEYARELKGGDGLCLASLFAEKCSHESLPVRVVFATRNQGIDLEDFLCEVRRSYEDNK
jgi:hypothetical protein